MKKTAILLDLGFVLHKLYRLLGNRPATASELHAFALRCLKSSEEELFRIYCYHCPPYGETQTHPVTRKSINLASTSTFHAMSKFLRDLMITDNVAYRSGELSFDGWVIKKRATDDLVKTGRAIVADDFKPDLKQKGVDMKIGLDVAWLASKSIVDRIILITADSDFVPAMKFARREGVQVTLITLGHKQIKQELKIHTDELRSVNFP